MLAEEGCHAQIERRIVDEDEYIRLLGKQCLFGYTEITPDVPPMVQHRRKAHESHVPVVQIQAATGVLHPVAAKSCKGIARV